MNVIRSLTWRYMKKNKSRTTVIIIGVAVSVAMLTAVFAIAATLMDLMYKDEVAFEGPWNAEFLNVAGQDISKISQNNAVEKTAVVDNLGEALLPYTENMRIPYLTVSGYSNFDLISIEVLEGRLPENESELALAESAIRKSGIPWNVGDQVTLPYGVRTRILDGTEMTLNSRVQYLNDEIFTASQERTYTIVGIVNAPAEEMSTFFYRGFSGLQQETLAENHPYTVSVAYKDFRKLRQGIYPLTEELAGQVRGVNAESGVLEQGTTVEYHRNLLMYVGISKDTRFLFTLYGAVLVICIIILIGSVSLINNAFSISLSERSRTLGMLSSVGATKRQKRSSVFFEATMIGCVAIPLGLAAGALGIGITLFLLDPLLQKFLGTTVPIQLVLPWSSIVAVVVFSLLTLFISAWIPAVRASRITAINAIRQNNDFVIKSNDVRTSVLTRKLFGFEAELGLKNLKRNKHHYRATVFSLIISVILFLSASAFSLFINESYSMTNTRNPYDIAVFMNDIEDENIHSLIDRLMTVENADTITERVSLDGQMELAEDHMSQELKERVSPYEDLCQSQVELIAMDDKTLAEYLEKAGIPETVFAAAEGAPSTNIAVENGQLSEPIKGILVNRLTYKVEHDYYDLTLLNVDLGTELPYEIYDYHTRAYRQFDLQVAAVTEEKTPFMYNYVEGSIPLTFVIAKDQYEELKNAVGNGADTVGSRRIQYTSDTPEALQKELAQITNDYPGISLYTSDMFERRQNEWIRTIIISVFLYGFVTLIALVCLANILNTISTGMALRKREFAMLQSIGITPKGMKRVIRWEGLFYAIKSLVYALPISFAAILLMYEILQRNFDFGFMLPWGGIAIAVIGVFLIVGITMLYASRKYRGQNVVETLRDENL